MKTLRARYGFTLIEVMISMTLLLFILGIATNTFRRQSSQLSAQSGRLEAQQTALFSLGELDRELRLAGTGVADMQPVLAFAGADGMVFNADMVGNAVGDPAPVYIDIEADEMAVSVFRSVNKLLLPTHATWYYPDSTHMKSVGAPSGAETIAFWISLDSSTTATNDYVLWRRVNHMTPRLVAKGIVKNAADTVFQYFKSDSAGNLTAIPSATLPLRHTASTHGAPTDVGAAALIDSIKTVRIRMQVVYQDRKGPVYRRLDHTIRLMNAGLVRRKVCGETPTGVVPIVSASLDANDNPQVSIKFAKSSDESSGEKDVERYALFKRLSSEATTLNEPFASLPAGSDTIRFVDQDVVPGTVMVYGASSQDCTPANSNVTTAAAVTIPTPPVPPSFF